MDEARGVLQDSGCLCCSLSGKTGWGRDGVGADGGDCQQYHQPYGERVRGYAYFSHVLVLQMYINNLTTNTAYEVRIRAATQSLVGMEKVHEGEWSDMKAVFCTSKN